MKFTLATKDDFFKNWPSDWPDKAEFVSQHDVTRAQRQAFRALIEANATERQVEKFLAANKEVLSLLMFMFSTGHHATWLYPKRTIRPGADDPGGLIPDYLAAAANSDGVSWFILELKSPSAAAFRKRGKHVCLSSAANEGICQLMEYIDAASRSQSYLRDELGLKGFREPRGVLLIGTETESADPAVMDFKGAWNRMNTRVQIKSYTSLLRQLEQKIPAD